MASRDQLLQLILGRLDKLGDRIDDVAEQGVRNEAATDDVRRSQARADESRKGIHGRLDGLTAEVSGMATAQALSAKATETLTDRLDVVEPIVSALKEARIEKGAVRKAIRTVCKNGYVAGGSLAGSGVWIWHQWDGIRDWILRILK